MKKVLSFFAVLFVAVLLVACGAKEFDVTFDQDFAGAPEAKVVKVEKGKKVEKPANPTRDDYNFVEWLLDGAAYDFEAAVEKDLVLKAKWEKVVEVTVKFNLDYEGAENPADQVIEKGAVAEEPAEPTRVGFVFLGWFAGSAEHDFANPVEANLSLVARWRQDISLRDAEAALGSLELPEKTVENLELPKLVGEAIINWSSSDDGVVDAEGKITQAVKNKTVKLIAEAGEATREFWVQVYGSEVDLDATYSSGFSEIIELNPLMSTGSADSDVYDNLISSLYGGDYDWEDAIANGYADFPGDFSKIKSDRNPDGTVDMPSIKYKKTLGMAAAYPFSLKHETDNSIPGSYGQLLDQEAAKELFDDVWKITLRRDLQFEDGTQITADTFDYSFMQYLNPKLNNARANYLFNEDYIPLINAKAYYDEEEGVHWSDVGFVKLSDYEFMIQLTKPSTQYHVMTYLGILALVHPAKFAAGFNEDGTKNNYGSVQNPLSSYGPFTLVNDYEDTETFTFLRNEKYYQAWNIPFAKLNGPIIKDQEDVINEFKAGRLDVAGVGGEYWDEFRDHVNLYVSPSNSFYRLAISMERPDDKAKPILKYDGFRRALYLATDRNDFANNVQPPSEGALGYLSNIHQVSEWASQAYASSTLHKQQLEDLGLAPEQGGYDSEEAFNLFVEARAAAIADGHYAEGEKISIEFLYYDAGSNTRIANWVKEQYEEVFNADGKDNFEVVLNPVSSEELNAQRDAGDFDLIFTGMSGATFQATFGMGYIFSPTFSTFLVGKGHGVPELEVEADVSNLLILVLDKDEFDEDVVDAAGGKVPSTMRTKSEQYLYDTVVETDGIFSGTFDELFLFWNSIPEFEADYDGQEEDLTSITAALERALLEQMIAVPLFSSTSAAVYQENVVRLAHAYHLFLGWGGMSYMYKTKAAE